MSRKIQVSPASCLLPAWFAAANGWRPLLAVLAAALIHECGHFLVLRLCGARVYALRLGVLGAVLETDCARLPYGRELAGIVSGPAANFLAAAGLAAASRFRAAAFARSPFAALCGANLALCAFNLLPVRPLDGGRALECAVSWAAGPAAGDTAARWIGALCAAALSLALALFIRHSGGNLWLLPPAAGLLSRAIREAGGFQSNST